MVVPVVIRGSGDQYDQHIFLWTGALMLEKASVLLRPLNDAA